MGGCAAPLEGIVGLDDIVDKAKDLAGDAADKAKELADDAKDVAGDVAERAKDVAGSVSGHAHDLVHGDGDGESHAAPTSSGGSGS